MIHPNQKLKISGSKPSPANNAGNTAMGTDVTYIYHTVKKGDTLWDIAQQYKGVTVEDIKKWNNLGNSSKLQVGQKLKIAKNG